VSEEQSVPLRGFASISALVFVGCTFSLSTEPVTGDAAVIDGRMIDGPPDDIDADGVKNTADNCPAVANPMQFDEDGDMRGDECDPCPQLGTGADHADGDGDTIGNACDPRPGTAGDELAYWNGFHTASATLPEEIVMIHGTAARWSIAGGFLVFARLDDDWGMPAVDVLKTAHTVDTFFEITAEFAGTASAAGVAADIAANDTDGYDCQARLDNDRREMWRRNPAAPDGWSSLGGVGAPTPMDSYRVILERTANDSSCTTTRLGQVSVPLGSLDDTRGNTRAGLFARNVDVRFKYIAVYTSP
jgi:hypothetical protein